MARIDVYGLTTDECRLLRAIALKKYGKASVSLLAKKTLLSLLEEYPHQDIDFVLGMSEDKKRTTLRLPLNDRTKLETLSAEHNTSINDFIRNIVQGYLYKNPVLSKGEVDMLYQSNGQLLRIGRNINQIARQLNAMEGVSLTSDHITKLHTFIDEHTKKVGDVLLANRRRFS